jgi:outer membrane protein, heavy metal efflux system
MALSPQGAACTRRAPLPRSLWALAERSAPVLAAALVAMVLAGCAGVAMEPRYRTLRKELDRREMPPPAPQPVSFSGGMLLEREALVREVLARNPSLRAARAAWRAALAEFPQAVALDDPMAMYGV